VLVPQCVRILRQEVQQMQQQQQQDDLSGVEAALEQLHTWLHGTPSHAPELALMPGALASLAGLLQALSARPQHASSARLAFDCLAALHCICSHAAIAQQQQQQPKDVRALMAATAGLVEGIAAVLVWSTSDSWVPLLCVGPYA
jgi:hypothetical protein